MSSRIMLGVALGRAAAGLAVARDRSSPRSPGVCSRRKCRAPPSTNGSISKSSSHTARSRRCSGRRVLKRSVGSRRCPSPETTKSFVRHRCGPPAVRKRGSRCARTAVAGYATDRYSATHDGGRDDEALDSSARTARPGATGATTTSSVASTCSRRRRCSQGVREVQAGISFCLSLPLDFPGGTALNQRRHPPAAGADRGHGRQPRRLLQRPHERDAGLRRPQVRRRLGRRRGDAVAAVLDPVGLARPRRRRVRRRRRRRRGGRLLQRLPGRHRPGRARSDDAARRRQRPPLASPSHLGLEHMAVHGVQGRGVLVDLAPPPRPRLAGRRPGRRSQEIMAADGVVVEPGDMLLLHTGFATKLLEWGGNPDPREALHDRAPTSTPTTRRCSSGSPTRRSPRSSPTTTRSRACWARTATRAATRSCPIHHLCLFKLGVPLGELWYLARAGGLAARARPQPLPAHRARRCACPGIVGSPLTPVATV